ncbi:MAG TPA: CbrC family protein [Pyrinomonadaceae bacterium]|nr:CbrC family protein [Pyrinomonadaceae bacterium]
MNTTSKIPPSFKYHPDPIATGSFEARELTCACCGQVRSYVYVGPVYAEADLEEKICPWCISSGLAHEMFGVEFTDIDAIGDYESKASVPVEVKEEIAYRTPGFNGWQQERWLVHCGDASAFLGPAGKDELKSYGSQELIDSLRADRGMDEASFRDYLDTMNKQTGPTAYVFRCLHCGLYQGYSDFS